MNLEFHTFSGRGKFLCSFEAYPFHYGTIEKRIYVRYHTLYLFSFFDILCNTLNERFLKSNTLCSSVTNLGAWGCEEKRRNE